jgi:hypothetical protein
MHASDYNSFSKLLHNVLLGIRPVTEISFEIEKTLFSKGDLSQLTDGRHVFVSGLARSGTTILMRSLFETASFASLTYEDMPFVLAPNLWKQMSRKKSSNALKERAHKDGILINDKSPEALDEVFWKVLLEDNYIQNDRLLINKILSGTLDSYEQYMLLVIKRNFNGKKLRYLSKNNNNILRLNSLLGKFPNAFVIVPFRDPLQHAISLLAQHHNFCKIQSDDKFALNYMTWVGHYEFGLNQKPFYLEDDLVFNRMLEYDKNDINFWLLTWLNYYSYILKKYSGKVILFCYEEFCKEPGAVLHDLAKRIHLSEIEFNPLNFELKMKENKNADQRVLDRCLAVYENLCRQAVTGS